MVKKACRTDSIRRFVLCEKPYLCVYLHLTKDIVEVVNDKCELIVTMNASKAQLKKLCDKTTRVYYLSAFCELKNAIRVQTHIKLYVTRKFAFFSTANLSLTAFPELTVQLERTPPVNAFLSALEEFLQAYAVKPACKLLH